jgi:hypothetical protein
MPKDLRTYLDQVRQTLRPAGSGCDHAGAGCARRATSRSIREAERIVGLAAGGFASRTRDCGDRPGAIETGGAGIRPLQAGLARPRMVSTGPCRTSS